MHHVNDRQDIHVDPSTEKEPEGGPAPQLEGDTTALETRIQKLPIVPVVMPQLYRPVLGMFCTILRNTVVDPTCMSDMLRSMFAGSAVGSHIMVYEEPALRNSPAVGLVTAILTAMCKCAMRIGGQDEIIKTSG